MRLRSIVPVCATAALCVAMLSMATAQPPGLPKGQNPKGELPARPRTPGGQLSDHLGTYHTIEGTRMRPGSMKLEANTLVVDTVDGKKLDKPLYVYVRHVELPADERCVLKGYELGEMIGRPPAEYAAAKERGQDPAELAKRDATIWRWRPYFVVLIAAEPRALEVHESAR